MAKPRCRIAVITDVHYSAKPPVMAVRRGDWAVVMLRRTVQRLNRYIKPDVTVVLGDLVDDPQAADAMDLLRRLRAILDDLQSPWLAIPGNHDPAQAKFYEVFDQADYLDINGVRLVTFDDPEEPGYNAVRTDEGVKRMAAMAAGHDGPLVALQHVPVGEPRSDVSHGYTNSAQVLAAMREHGYTLALSGHSHIGMPLKQQAGVASMVVPAMCEAPFNFALVSIDGDDISAEVLTHQMPAELELKDYHSHTQFAYCSEDVSFERSSEFASLMGLKQLALTEHSGQLYFERKMYWSAEFCERGIEETRNRDRRMDDYWRQAAEYRSDSVIAGLEVDADFHGNLVVEPADLARAQIVVGAVHWLAELRKPEPDLEVAGREFLAVTKGLCENGVDILAHPFRVFRRSGNAAPTHLWADVVKLLKQHGVAAEINFHVNQPVPELFAGCLEAGVPISFGGDAHGLWEVGEFHPHLDLIKQIGFTGDVREILIEPLDRLAARSQ